MFLAFILMFSVILPVSAESSSSGRYIEAGSVLESLGLLRGDDDGDLGLNNTLKRQHMVVMISRLYGEEEAASKFTGPNKFKDLKPVHIRDIPYIAWAVDKGLISGNPDGTFGHGNETTIQEYQKVLLTALGYPIRTEDWGMVPELSERYGLMDGLSVNPKSNLSRGQMAVMTLNALHQEKNGQDITLAQYLKVTIPEAFKVNSIPKVDDNTLILQGQVTGASNLFLYLKPISSSINMESQLIAITLDENGNFSHKIDNLEVGDYHYRFQSGTRNTPYQAISIDVLPFALKDITANNLKEIHLNFTQAVDRAIASLPINYTTTAGSIKNIRFEDNDTKIVITLNGIMSQQTKYTLTAMKIRSASGEEKTIDKYEFEALDIEAPKMISYSQLGNIGLRFYFSEPIKSAKASNFKLNGKDFFGRVEHENNMITLSYSSSNALKEGTHSLIISGIEDYAGYKPIEYNHQITIAKDTSPLKIVNSSATPERVIIEFNKDIYPGSTANNNFFWKSGNTKRNASKVTISGNKAIVDFTANTLSPIENIIYVENVVDYFGNKITDSTKVVPVIDTTRPEVISYYLSRDGKSITVYYSKNVAGNNRRDYTILDENNKTINIRDIQGSGAEYIINLYAPLPVGSNSFNIDGVQDTTTLKNPLVPFNTTIEMKDIEKPRILNHIGYGNNILIYFSKVMDMSTVTDPSNYIMKFKGRQDRLPINTSFIPGDDGKSIAMTLPEYYEGDKVSIGSPNNLIELNIFGLKDTVGNDMDPLMLTIKFDATSSGNARAVDYYNTRPGREGVLLDSNLIKVRFSIPIVQASEDDFKLEGRKIHRVMVDGTDEVIIYLEDNDSTSLPSGSLSIKSKNNMKTIIDTGVESSVIRVLDEIPPRVKAAVGDLTVYGNQIELPFTEELEDVASSLYKRDLEIVRLADNTLLSEDDYTTTLKASDKSILIVTINNRVKTSGYSIRLAGEHNEENLSYIRDKDGNLAIPSGIYITNKEIFK